MGYIPGNAWSWKAETVILAVFQKSFCDIKSCRFLNWCSRAKIYAFIKEEEGLNIEIKPFNFNLWNSRFFLYKVLFEDSLNFLIISGLSKVRKRVTQCSELKKFIEISRRCWLLLSLTVLTRRHLMQKYLTFQMPQERSPILFGKCNPPSYLENKSNKEKLY